MKKKTKNLLLLVAVFVVLVAGYFALDLIPEDTGEENQDTEKETIEVTEFEVADIASYVYKNPEYEIGFEVTESGYTHYRDAVFPVNGDSVADQLNELGDLTAMQVIDSTDKAEYGLNDPRVTISVTLTDGTERNFYIGDSALFEDADYLLDVEKNTIYLVGQYLATEFTMAWSDLVAQEEMIKVSSDQIVDVAVETDGVQIMYITYDETKENPWQLTTTEGTFDGDNDAVLDAVGAYNSYYVDSAIEYNCMAFSEYGLDAPTTTVRVRYKETAGEASEKENAEEDAGAEDVQETTSELKTLFFEFGNLDEEKGTYYVRINGSSYVYSMTEYYAGKVSEFDLEELKYQPEENEDA